MVLNVRTQGNSSTSSSSCFSCRTLRWERRRKIRSEAATTRGALARARASYQFDNAHPLNGRRDGRGRSPVSNDVSSSVSFSSSISFTVRAPLTCPSRERKRERERSRRRHRRRHELTRLSRDAKDDKLKKKASSMYLKLCRIIIEVSHSVKYI